MSTLLPEVAQFLAPQPLKMHIGGRWTEAAGGKTFETIDPGNGEHLAFISAGEETDVHRAVQAAREAFDRGDWTAMPAGDRAMLLHRLAALIEKNAEVISQIESLDVGKLLSRTRTSDVPQCARALRYYADLSIQVRRSEPIVVSGREARSVRLPCGVCGLILPWNAPFLLAGWGIAPALAAGNTVVIKPAENAPLSTLFLCKLAEEAGFPPGVINVVTGLGGTAGAALANHSGINRIAFTGSTEVGRRVGESCGRNFVPVKLELGGKGAAVVFEDVDVEAVAKALAAAVTASAGQVCCTATRWIVHESIRDGFLAKAAAILGGMKIGYGSDPATQIGPLISNRQRQRVLGYIDKGTKECQRRNETGPIMAVGKGASTSGRFSSGS